MLVKICGVRALEGADAIRSAGAELAGINFVPGSKRFVAELDHARALVAALGPGVAVAGVFADQTESAILAVLAAVPLSYVQLHGEEPPSLCAAIARRVPVIKAINAAGSPSVEAYRPHVHTFLFDGPRPGSGRAFEWSRALPADARPYFVAGGLDPENVAAAIAATAPDGVDTASGVEIGGRQDPARIEAFVRAAKGAPRP